MRVGDLTRCPLPKRKYATRRIFLLALLTLLGLNASNPVLAEPFPVQQTIAPPNNARALNVTNTSAPSNTDLMPQRRGLTGLLDRVFRRTQPTYAPQVAPNLIEPAPQKLSSKPNQSAHDKSRAGLRTHARIVRASLEPQTSPYQDETSAPSIPKSPLFENMTLGQIPDDASCDPRFMSSEDFDRKCIGPFADPALARKILSDRTLRRGDAVITQRGIVIFAGKSGPYHSANQFLPLDRADMLSDNVLSLLSQINLLAQQTQPISLDIVSRTK